MSIVAFIARDPAGTNFHGTATAGNPSIIEARGAKDISLNLSPADVESYARHGSDLHVVLNDGTQLQVKGFYDAASTGSKNLFLSEDGSFIEVVLEDKAEGMLFASYEPLDLSGKWSAYDDMVFLGVDRVEPVVAPLAGAGLGALGLLGAAGAGAAALVGGGGDDSSTSTDPTVEDPEGTYSVGEGDPDGVDIKGTGEPGSDVTVTIGDTVKDTTVDDDGNWSVNFPTDDLPPDGEYETIVDVVAPDGTEYELDGPTIDIDMTPPEVDITDGTKSTDDVVNAEEQSSGAIISGTGEAGATVTLEIDGETQTTTVGDDGSWSVTFSSEQITTGEYETEVTITTTDPHGNSTVTTDILAVDTQTSVTITGGFGGNDGVVNASEAAAGLSITGTAEAGASVSVSIDGVVRTATADADGNWTASFEGGSIAEGDYSTSIEVTATDAAGNTASASTDLVVDTVAPALSFTSGTETTGNVVNGAEQEAGTVITGTGEPGTPVLVSLPADANAASQTTLVDADGNWSVTFPAGQIATGDYSTAITVTGSDAAGNSTTVEDVLVVDTETTVAIDSGLAGGDDIANAAEVAAGIAITGTAEAGAAVVVTVEGETRETTADADGIWTVTYEAGSLPSGEYDSTIEVTSTDEAGNSASSSSSIRVDTEIGTVAISDTPVEGDDVINAAERSDGVTITGTATPGEEVTVTLGTATGTTVADADGNWSYDFAADDIPEGNETLDVTATISDDAGNTASDSDSVGLDTVVTPFTSDDTQAGDDTVNYAELQAGFALTGTVEAGSTVSVEVNGTSHDATVDADGNWTLTLDADDLPEGTESYTAEITATDAAGNVATLSQPFSLDTEISTPDLEFVTLNTSEDIARVEITDTVDINSVQTLEADGTLAEQAATITEDGTLETHTFDTAIPDGTNLLVNASDAAGNSSSTLVLFQDGATETTLDHAGLTGVNLDVVDLEYAAGSNLTLTEADINALSGNSDTLTIRGNGDDTVTLAGATADGTRDVDGETFEVYTIGDDGTTLLVEEDVNVVI